jgi:hypothetical protein
MTDAHVGNGRIECVAQEARPIEREHDMFRRCLEEGHPAVVKARSMPLSGAGELSGFVERTETPMSRNRNGFDSDEREG